MAYGKNLFGGVAVKRRITSNYVGTTPTGTNNFSNNFVNAARSGTKNEYLHVQHAICQDGIDSVVGVKVNDFDYNDADQRFSHSIRTYRGGGTADPIASANGIPSTNTFTGTAYASSTFKLDRDDPQYNGEPQMGFLVKGRRVRAVTLSAGVYSLSGTYSYSNNPALCLLDYLLNTTFGRGLSVSEVDLESFYNSAVVCGTTVSTGRAVSGVINGGVGTRNLPLYECNITLSSTNTIRDNIESLMNTMALAELTWSSQGKYKLLVEYPTSTVEQDALVDADHYFTDDDIIRDEISIAWPSAEERLNQVTLSFSNEHEDFKSDSVTWPKSFSTAHNTYLAEDNNQPFTASVSIDGTTDPYHALATAEQLVREARASMTINLTVTKRGLSIEPGDFINITSTTSNISDEVFRVESIQINADFTVGLTCSSFSYEMLAWNVNDDIAYSTRPTFDFTVEPVTSLVYTAGRPDSDHTAIAELTWTAPTDGSFKAIVYYTDGAGDLKRLGETSSDNFLIHPNTNWTDGQSVTFTVKAQTPLGRLSTGVAVTNTVVRTPPAPTSFSVAETLYQTNKASGVKARATISFSEPSGGVEPKDYRVEYYRDEDGSTYELLGYTVGQEYIFDDVRAGNYHFRVTPISWFDHEGTTLIGTKLILGLSAIPSDPTGFVSKVTDSGILLTWDTPSDLDVVSGGTTEIRYVRNDIVTPKWEIAQTIVSNISGSTTTATLPIAAGYYLIKHVDSSGNACAEPAQILNSFVGPDYNAITTVTEDPTFAGTKTDCTVYPLELVTNGTFDTDASSWTLFGAPTISIVSGAVRVAYLATANPRITQSVSGLVVGRDYTVTVDLVGTTGTARVDLDHNGVDGAGNVISSTTSATSGSYTFTAVTDNATVQLFLLGTTGYADFDNVSIKEVVDATLELDALTDGPELVTNGTFDTDTTGWGATTATLSVSSARLRITTTGASWGSAWQQITGLDASKSYRISLNGYVGTGDVRYLIGDTANSGTVVSSTQSAVDISPSFIVTGRTDFYITVLAYGASGVYADFDNISVVEVDGAANTTMTYLFDNSIDLGSVENIRLVPSLTAVITDGVTVVADYDPVSAVTRFAGPIVDASVSFEVRTTDDDPAGSPTWSDWETFTVGNYRHRAFEFRLTGVVSSATYTIEISELSLTADKADVTKRGTSTSSAGADTTITFASAFYGGIGGTDLPYVGFSAIGGSAGDSIDIVSITKSAFVYSVYNSGARVVRNISWQAIGQ